MKRAKYDLAERYWFLIELGATEPLALGAKGHEELRRLKTKLTGLTGDVAARAVAEDQKQATLARYEEITRG